ncbi:MAG: hypothetical protein DMD83_13220 [Candidatus Rokuibacteriota bacterium]|nr:MAG: hypothetical protein DMD83_13220 [Candidatus Rokubacteria bacterium]
MDRELPPPVSESLRGPSPGGGPRARSLREAAAVIFALAAILPILLFVYLLQQVNVLQRGDVQAGLLLALVVAVGGFLIFRRIMDQVVRLARGFQPPGADRAGTTAKGTPLAPVPGLGRLAEIDQAAEAFYQMLGDLRGATQRLEDLVFKLGALNETVELAARIPVIQDLLGPVLQKTMLAVRATVASIMLVDKEGQALRLAASRGIPDEIASRAEVRIGEGIAGRVVELGETVLVDDVETDPRFNQPSAPPYGSGSFICMPIRAGERVIGVINIARKKNSGDAGAACAEPFSAIDLQFLNALMTYIGYAVDNARLLEDAQQSARRLQAVVDDLRTTQAQLVRAETLRAVGQLSSRMARHLNNLFRVIRGRAGSRRSRRRPATEPKSPAACTDSAASSPPSRRGPRT